VGKMAVFKASSYTRKANGAKASVRYIENRPGKDKAKIHRNLWGIDGLMGRWEAYRMIDEAAKGSYFYRLIINLDPHTEDTHKDLYLREITEQTMHGVEERVQTQVQWVAAVHDDHTPLRHMHIVAVLPRRLDRPDLYALIDLTTQAALEQRAERDKALALSRQLQERGKEAEWER